MKVCIPRESNPNEKRVAATPETIKIILSLGFEVLIEQNAGINAGFSDDAYFKEGAIIVQDSSDLWKQADILLKVQPPSYGNEAGQNELQQLKPGQTVIGFLSPSQNIALLREFAKNGINAIAIDAVPRISRAQKLDALSSMANIGGYRAVIEAAHHFGRFFTGQMTAAGKVPPAKFLVIGAGVAGLAAIGAATAMGAVVRAFDTRPEVEDQVKSMGAEFLYIDLEEESDGGGGYARIMSKEFVAAEKKLFAQQSKEVDIIITTALIPGQPAPKLITEDMVKQMKPGSVIVDLAAEQGGNCEVTKRNQAIKLYGITVIGYTDLSSRMASQASQLYGNNLANLLSDLCPKKDGLIDLNMEDDVVKAITIVNKGQVNWPPPNIKKSQKIEKIPSTVQAEKKENKKVTPNKSKRIWKSLVGMAITLALILGLGAIAPSSFMGHFTVFVLAIFVGWQVIWNVKPALHTPLMSVTNAISGIIVIGALLQTNTNSNLILALAAFSILIASINISGGFFVTQRMLRMFRKEED